MESFGRLHDVGERARAFKLDKTEPRVIHSFDKNSTIRLAVVDILEKVWHTAHCPRNNWGEPWQPS